MCACVIVLAVVLGSVPVAAQTPPPYAPEQAPAPPVRPAAMLGAALYQQNCAPCHGLTGAGDGAQAATLSVAPQPLDDPVRMAALAPAEAFHITKFGSASGAMPALQDFLSDDQLWHAVAFAWSLHTDAGSLAAGAARYAEQCAACHGESGRGDGPDAAGKVTSDFTNAQAMNVRSLASLDAGWREAHGEIGAELPAQARQEVLDAVRAFTLLPPNASPYAGGVGVIDGRLVQGTAGAAAPAVQTMTLMAYMNFTPVATFTTTTDADGAFRFTELATDPDVVYYVGVEYDDIAYGTDLFGLSPVTPTVQLAVPIYETTTDPAGLHVSRMQWVVDHAPGMLRVRQILRIGNNQDRTIVGQALTGAAQPVTAALPVPADAADIVFQDGALDARYQRVGTAIYDTTPIRPGAQSRQILMGYTLPYQGTSAALVADLAYPVDALTLLIGDLPGLAVEVAAPLEAVGNQTVQGNAYRVWNGQLEGAQPITVGLQNLIVAGGADPRLTPAVAATPPLVTASAPPAQLAASIPPAFAALGVGALVLVIGGGILYWRYARDKRQTLQNLHEARDRLLTEIAAIDDRHAQGELDDETWSAERVTLMRTLRMTTTEIERHQAGRKRGRGDG